MKEWTQAAVYAVLAAGTMVFVAEVSWAEVLPTAAMLVAPFRLAVWLKGRCGGCWLTGLFS